MKRIGMYLIPALLALQTAAIAQAGQRLGVDDIDVRVVSDYAGALNEYPVQGRRHVKRAYVEAHRGDGYAIEVYNRTAYRVGLVIAVDGRNVISGAHSKLRSSERMYILGPHQRAVYEGWRTARNQVNRFYFTDEGASYAAAWDDHSAMGVIAVAAFRERGEHHYNQDQAKPYSRSAPNLREQPGTGFGEEEWSPSRLVHFEPKGKSFARHFLKYEWRETLCERGVIDCHYRNQETRENRFWPDRESYGFAPHPFRK